MAPLLYSLRASPPCRAVLITAKAIGLTLKEKEISFFKNEHLTPEFQKANPQHTIPTFIDDDGFAFWDSHAIMAYIITKYATNDNLYPKDLRKRAVINQRLFFESESIFFHTRNMAKMVILEGQNFVDEQEKEGIIRAYGYLEKFLQGHKWMAGDFLSIADYSLIATVSSVNGWIPVDSHLFPNLMAWMERCETLPEYEANRFGVKESSRIMLTRLQTLKSKNKINT